MNPSSSDHIAAAEMATAAGQRLLALRQDHSLEGERLKTEGDRQSQAHLAAQLGERFPGDAVLSEEARDAPRRLAARRVWIIDPLDGTREFSERDRDDWAVHVALAIDGVAVVGAVALPVRGLTLATGHGLPGPKPLARRPRLLVSRTRPTPLAERLAGALGVELVPMGSAGAKAMAVVLGEAELYVHSGGQYEWDSAAPVAVALAAGFHASRLDGAPLRYNQPNPWLPDLVIGHPSIAQSAIDVAAHAGWQ